MSHKIYPILAFLFLLSVAGVVNAQTTIYSENFNGSGHTFSLSTVRTIDGKATLPASDNSNHFSVDNIYAGGCGYGISGFCIRNIAATPDQPGPVTGAPQSKYMHLVGDAYASQTPPALNACINPAGDDRIQPRDRELYYFSEMANDISTLGKTGVQLTFYWLNAGSNENYAQLYYSTDGGSTWVLAKDQMYNQPTWKSETYPASPGVFDNLAQLRIGFRFVSVSKYNTVNPAPLQPSLAVDEILIAGNGGSVTPTITTTFNADASYCPGAQINVPFTSTGTFTAGNNYKVQLSDANGSFANPTDIGTLSSTGNSGTVNATIPAGAANGTGYKVRVVSTNPTVNGTPNANAFAIAPGQEIVVTRDPAGANNLCGGSITLSIPNTYTGISWIPGGQTSNSIVVTAAGDYSVSANGTGGCPAQSAVISISGADAPSANFTYSQPSGYLIEFTNTSENGVSYVWNFGSATTTSVNPTFTFPFDGEYPVKLVVTNECGTDSITIMVEVKKLLGMEDVKLFDEISLFPNPLVQDLQITLSTKEPVNAQIAVLDARGAQVYNENRHLNGTQTFPVPFKQLASGIYLVKINTPRGQASYRIIKN